MRLVVQRVARAQVSVENKLVGKIGKGLLVFVGFSRGDEIEKADALAAKLVHLRIFSDELGKMNLSLLDVKGEVLIISQFTLYADLTGRRPSFTESAKPEKANELYEYFKYQVETLIKKENPSFKNVESGVFGAHMSVELENDGPVTICLEK
jgi:D-tyrosyl-tRNA(Tyr) deacylase